MATRPWIVSRSSAPSAAPAPTPTPESAHLRQRRAEVLMAVLETLPPQLREAFVLCDLQDMPVPAAAAELGISPGNLRVRATRARARIRSELVRLGWLTEDSHDKERDHGDA
ncbi:sigma-70 region 4 domain-containing protein [Nannocystis pusilla]|uniref:Sigma-70 region 4 domain-containing protein n=1 Tax=Nannocystis pusilla TaxID=889268 RepID=A0A9X3ENI7_9BACT|nr:sigma-70 region 4 domain-containing protein [Nannocystis pusilla]